MKIKSLLFCFFTVVLVTNVQYPFAAVQDEVFEKELKLCMNSCISNSCSGPASVVEKNCSRKCSTPKSSTNNHSPDCSS